MQQTRSFGNGTVKVSLPLPLRGQAMHTDKLALHADGLRHIW